MICSGRMSLGDHADSSARPVQDNALDVKSPAAKAPWSMHFDICQAVLTVKELLLDEERAS